MSTNNSLDACVSVLMPCRNAGRYVQAAVESVLRQPQCLELLVADGESTDDTLEVLEALARADSRLRIVSRRDQGPADAINKAFNAARGTLIGWLNANDLMPAGTLARAVNALKVNPNWLMVYGEAEEFNSETGLTQRFPTLPPSAGIKGFQSHCFICQPAVVFRRSMVVLLGKFDPQWRTSFNFDYWLRAFDAFPNRIGYIPHLQGQKRLHGETITSKQRSQMEVEATKLLARHFGVADAKRLHKYASELQLGIAEIPPGVKLDTHLQQLFESVRPSLNPAVLVKLQRTWLTTDKPKPKQTESDLQQSKALKLRMPATNLAFKQRPFGVNLIGHAFDIFGLGEAFRIVARSFIEAGIPISIVDVPAKNGRPSEQTFLEKYISKNQNDAPYAFNLICMSPARHLKWHTETGYKFAENRYSISTWFWETEQWPESWLPLLDVVDELWPPCQFTTSALVDPVSENGKPMLIMPLAAEIANPQGFCNAAAKAATRRHYGLPTNSVLFGYGFDLNSTATRKNPMGTLEAFQRAFPLPHLPATLGREQTSHPLSDKVSLLIKTFPPRRFSPEWTWLQKRAAEDSRITLIAESLPRDELLMLYGCCDAFLSLHRSEGYGLGIAEALQLGVDVISTDYGGNTDFCTGPLSHPVRWRKTPIPRGSYPNADGHFWAEPDLEHAAQLCQHVAERRLALSLEANAFDPSRDKSVLNEYRKRFAFIEAGARYRERLEFLWANAKVLTNKVQH